MNKPTRCIRALSRQTRTQHPQVSLATHLKSTHACHCGTTSSNVSGTKSPNTSEVFNATIESSHRSKKGPHQSVSHTEATSSPPLLMCSIVGSEHNRDGMGAALASGTRGPPCPSPRPIDIGTGTLGNEHMWLTNEAFFGFLAQRQVYQRKPCDVFSFLLRRNGQGHLDYFEPFPSETRSRL